MLCASRNKYLVRYTWYQIFTFILFIITWGLLLTFHPPPHPKEPPQTICFIVNSGTHHIHMHDTMNGWNRFVCWSSGRLSFCGLCPSWSDGELELRCSSWRASRTGDCYRECHAVETSQHIIQVAAFKGPCDKGNRHVTGGTSFFLRTVFVHHYWP